jgi:hypothetical protein
MKEKQKEEVWIPEIFYDEPDENDSGTLQFPFIYVPAGKTMPKVLFIASKTETGVMISESDTGEIFPEPLAELDIVMHGFIEMDVIKSVLSEENYNLVKSAAGLKSNKR